MQNKTTPISCEADSGYLFPESVKRRVLSKNSRKLGDWQPIPPHSEQLQEAATA
jgi:hypothetical protein